MLVKILVLFVFLVGVFLFSYFIQFVLRPQYKDELYVQEIKKCNGKTIIFTMSVLTGRWIISALNVEKRSFLYRKALPISTSRKDALKYYRKIKKKVKRCL